MLIKFHRWRCDDRLNITFSIHNISCYQLFTLIGMDKCCEVLGNQLTTCMTSLTIKNRGITEVDAGYSMNELIIFERC